jgi:hypothetical protein
VAATCGLDFERRLSASSFEVRQSIAEALRELGFEITVDQLTRMEAKRGSLLGSSLMLKKQMPVLAVFEISTDASGYVVLVHLTDNIRNLVGKTWGVNRQYREILAEVQRRVDLGLAKLDGAASLAFAEATFWSRAADVGLIEQSNVLTAKAVGGAVNVAGMAIDGGTRTMPKAWKGVDSVTFTSTLGVTVLTLAETQAALGVAVMVASHPGSMPANLDRDVEAFAAMVEQRLTAAAGRAARVEVSDAQRPALEFLHQQAQIRSELPMRELHICATCRLEKITNPEYERIAARNEKIGDLVAGVGATINKGGISPTFVLGQVFKMKRLDPKYVCSRCQGMEDDERIVTFCPSCAELQKDVVLRLCPKCGFDFRTKAGTAPLWSAVVEEVAESAPAAEVPEVAVSAVAAAEVPEVAAPEVAAPEVAAAEVSAVAAAEVPGEAVLPVSAQKSPPAAPAPPAPPAVLPVSVPPPAAPAPPAPHELPLPVPAQTAPMAPSATAAWPTPADVPMGSPLPGKRGGKVCQMCRREYPSLWRLVIQTPNGFEERFVCGTSVTCQMPSVVPAVPV